MKTKKTSTAPTKVLVNFIQDRSGSMTSVWTETLSGFAVFVKDLQEKGAKDSIKYLFSHIHDPQAVLRTLARALILAGVVVGLVLGGRLG